MCKPIMVKRSKQAAKPAVTSVTKTRGCEICSYVEEYTAYSNGVVDTSDTRLVTYSGLTTCRSCRSGLDDGKFAAVGAAYELRAHRRGSTLAETKRLPFRELAKRFKPVPMSVREIEPAPQPEPESAALPTLPPCDDCRHLSLFWD
jgi:hypothetical protein